MKTAETAKQREYRKRRMFGLAFHNFFKQKPEEAQNILSALSSVFTDSGRTAISERLNLPPSFDAAPAVLASNRRNGSISRRYAKRIEPMDQEERARHEGRVFRAIGTAIIAYRSKNEERGLRIYRVLIPYLEGGIESKDRKRFAYLFDTRERVMPGADAGDANRHLDAVRVAAINQMIRRKEAQGDPDDPPADPDTPPVSEMQNSYSELSDSIIQKDPER